MSWTSCTLQEHGKIERSKLFICSKQGDCKKELYLGTFFSIKLSCFFCCFPQEAMSSYFGKTPFFCFWQWGCGKEPWNLFSMFFFGVICAFDKEVLCMCAWLLFFSFFLVIFWEVVAKHCWSCYTRFFCCWERCACFLFSVFVFQKVFETNERQMVGENVKSLMISFDIDPEYGWLSEYLKVQHLKGKVNDKPKTRWP